MTPKRLFDYNVEKLVYKGVARYADYDPFRGKELPSGKFLLIPRCPVELFNDQAYLDHIISRIEYNNISCTNYIDPLTLSDIVTVPSGPHLISDIEDGAAKVAMDVADARSSIKSDNRTPYTVWQAIVHALVFPNFLHHHGMDILGSRSETGFRPVLYLHHGLPKFDQWWAEFDSPRWGAPSYGTMVVP